MAPFPKLSRPDLIASMEEAHADFLSLIERLASKEAGKVGATSRWSLRDLLAHMVGWHHEAMKRIPELVRGGQDRSYDVGEMNRKFVEGLKEIPWGLLLRDLRNMHSGLVGMAKEIPERFLDPRSGIYQWLYQVGCGHYRDHQEAVRQWVAQLKRQRIRQEERP